MGVRQAPALARACDLGVAMQLTNIARDVAEDAAEGRLYLPRAWLREQGLDPDVWLERPVFDLRIRRLVRRLLRRADELYDRARPGVALLPFACRPGIHAARRIYAEIGRVLEAQDCDPSCGRAYVRSRRKALLLGQALLDAASPNRLPQGAPTLPEVRFLVRAVLEAQPPEPVVQPAERPARAGFEAIINTIHILEQRDREYWTRAAEEHGLEVRSVWAGTSS